MHREDTEKVKVNGENRRLNVMEGEKAVWGVRYEARRKAGMLRLERREMRLCPRAYARG